MFINSKGHIACVMRQLEELILSDCIEIRIKIKAILYNFSIKIGLIQ